MPIRIYFPLLLVIWIITSYTCISQNKGEMIYRMKNQHGLAKHFTDSLLKNEALPLIIYEKGCSCCNIDWHYTYELSDPNYIIWQVKQQWFIKKIDAYAAYEIVEVNSGILSDFYQLHKEEIQGEDYRNSRFYTDSTSGEQLELVYFPSRGGRYDVLKIYLEADSFEVYYNHHDAFYESKSRSLEWLNLTDELIMGLEHSGVFKSTALHYFTKKESRKMNNAIRNQEKLSRKNANDKRK